MDNKPSVTPLLSVREAMILKCIFQGLSSKQIAAQLYISTETVGKHRSNMLKKCGAKNTAELIAKNITILLE